MFAEAIPMISSDRSFAMNDFRAESLGADPATLGGNIAIFVSRDADAEHFSCLAVCKGPVRSGSDDSCIWSNSLLLNHTNDTDNRFIDPY